METTSRPDGQKMELFGFGVKYAGGHGPEPFALFIAEFDAELFAEALNMSEHRKFEVVQLITEES